MIGQEGPGIDDYGAVFRDSSQSVKEVSPISIIREDRAILDPADHDVVQNTGSVKSRTAWHGKENLSRGQRGRKPFRNTRNHRPPCGSRGGTSEAAVLPAFGGDRRLDGLPVQDICLFSHLASSRRARPRS